MSTNITVVISMTYSVAKTHSWWGVTAGGGGGSFFEILTFLLGGLSIAYTDFFTLYIGLHISHCTLYTTQCKAKRTAVLELYCEYTSYTLYTIHYTHCTHYNSSTYRRTKNFYAQFSLWVCIGLPALNTLIHLDHLHIQLPLGTMIHH